MTYSSQSYRPAAEDSRAFDVASRKAAAAIERTRGAAESLVESYTYWRRVRETTRQLSLLDDAALRDIGLDRSQITQVARSLALQKPCRGTGRAQRRAG